MSARRSSGTTANSNGGNLEAFVGGILLREGYHEFSGSSSEKGLAFANRHLVGGRQFASQVYVGPTIYGTDRYADFVVYDREIFPDSLVIECKWQEAGGSVDEKYPFLVENIALLGVPTIVVLDGGGYKPGAEEWLRRQVGRRPGMSGVMTMSEFQREVNRGLLCYGL